ncbi:MAG TPA: cysteine hydrolase, partial [Rhodobacterales bacterium]|nr:cysteine hydrolase [Rhodobacterales bacterium]
MTLTRDLPLDPPASALLFIDVQNFSAHRDGGEFKGHSAE